MISKTNVSPDTSFTRSILEFPRPNSITDIRSWFGLVNQASYTLRVTDVMEPFRPLLKAGSTFSWTPALEKAFRESQATIVKEIEHGIRIFDKSKPTCLATDWSKSGVGF